ncbi:MAG: ROK family protein [Clostridiales bacterium]|nr:ROK family protein [Clostridiales bacterium]
MAGNKTVLIRQANRALVFEALRTLQPATADALMSATGLSRPTLDKIIGLLAADRLIEPAGFAPSEGGRMPQRYAINAKAYRVIGVDLEFPTVRLCVADLNCQTEHYEKWVHAVTDDAHQVLDRLIGRIEGAIRSLGLPRSEYLGVGIGLPGLIDRGRGVSVSIERIVGWKDIDIAELIRARFELPVALINDVHALWMAESHLNKALRQRDAAYVCIRSGIGAACYTQGGVLHGEHGNAGFIGHTMVDPDGQVCRCGRRGCLETYAGELAMLNRYRATRDPIRAPVSSLEPKHDCDLANFYRAADAGDADARAIVEDAARHLAQAVVNLCLTIDARRAVLSGRPIAQCGRFREAVRSAIERIPTANAAGEPLELTFGQISEDLYPLGGCSLAIARAFQKPALNFTPAL